MAILSSGVLTPGVETFPPSALSPTPEADKACSTKCDAGIVQNLADDNNDKMLSLDFNECLRVLQCDVLLIFGKDDPWCKPVFAKRYLHDLSKRNNTRSLQTKKKRKGTR